MNLFQDSDVVFLCVEDKEDVFCKVHGYHTYKRNNEFTMMTIRLQEANNGALIGANSGAFKSLPQVMRLEMAAGELHDTFKDFNSLLGGGQQFVNVSNANRALKIATAGGAGEAVVGESVFKEGDMCKFVRQGADKEMQLNVEQCAKFTQAGMAFSTDGKVTVFMGEGLPFVGQYTSGDFALDKNGKSEDTFSFYQAPNAV